MEDRVRELIIAEEAEKEGSRRRRDRTARRRVLEQSSRGMRVSLIYACGARRGKAYLEAWSAACAVRVLEPNELLSAADFSTATMSWLIASLASTGHFDVSRYSAKRCWRMATDQWCRMATRSITGVGGWRAE
jgi:hypothetical protein